MLSKTIEKYLNPGRSKRTKETIETMANYLNIFNRELKFRNIKYYSSNIVIEFANEYNASIYAAKNINTNEIYLLENSSITNFTRGIRADIKFLPEQFIVCSTDGFSTSALYSPEDSRRICIYEETIEVPSELVPVEIKDFSNGATALDRLIDIRSYVSSLVPKNEKKRRK